MLAIHPQARTTPAVRAEIARSHENSGTLARRYGISAETVRKWRKRGPDNNGTSGDLYAAHYNRLVDFTRTKNVYAVGLWNKSSTAFNCRLSNSQYPVSAAVFLAGFSAAAQPWTPLLHFGRDLVEWRDASDSATLTLATALVTSWADKIANKLASSTASARPTHSATARNGLPGVTSDGTDDVLIQTDVTNVPAMGKAHTTFMQAYVDASAAAFSYLLADSDATGGATGVRAIGHNANGLRLQGTAGFGIGTIKSVDASIVVAFRDANAPAVDAGATHQGSINGGTTWTPENRLPMSNTTITKRVLFGNGAAADGVANRIAATLQEMGTIKRYVTPAEHDLLHGYLAWKWGRSAVLPASHPYKSAAPIYGGAIPVS